MQEEKYDFDTLVERRNTNCLKYDFVLRRGRPKDVLPLWVADMDFKTSEKILNAIHKRTEHGILAILRVAEAILMLLQAGWAEGMVGK